MAEAENKAVCGVGFGVGVGTVGKYCYCLGQTAREGVKWMLKTRERMRQVRGE